MEEQIPVLDQNIPQEIKRSSRKKLVILIGFIFFLISSSIGVYLLKNETKEEFDTKNSSKDEEKKPVLTSTPIPFYEMTIPYLRSRVYKSNLGELEEVSSNTTYTSYLTYYDSDGLRVNGQLTIPKGEVPKNGWPAVIFIHGYIPPAQYETLVNYSSYVDGIAREGFVVFKIDLRGHADSEGDASGAYYSSDYIIDVLNAKAALQTSSQIDPKRIGLWGHSMAGNVLMRTLASDPQIPAVVIWAGAVYTYDDWQDYGIQDGSYRPPAQTSERQRKREELFNTHGEFSSSSDFWKMVPATNYLSDVKGAVQLNHAVDDNVVNIGYSRDLAKLLEEEKIPHELKEYSSGGHNITGASFTQAMKNTVEFYKKYL